MGKENCKRPKAAVVKQETDATPKCKNTPVEPEEDSVEESEPEYELYFKVSEASSGKPMEDVKVRIVVAEGNSVVKSTDINGEFRRTVKVSGHVCQLKFESLDPIYKLKVANPSATTKQKGGGPTLIELERRLLEIVSVDPHFVPTGKDDDENLQIRYHIHGIKSAEDPDPKVYLAIRNNAGWLFRRQLTTAEVADGGNKLLKWDGKINHPSSGPLLNKLANPLIGPFQVLLMYDAPTGKIATDYETFNILYHSIKLKEGSYLEDPDTPPVRINPPPVDGSAQWSDHIKWIQYRLNKLGYFSGVVDGNLNAQTKRAVRRFTHEMINHQEADFAGHNAAVRLTVFLNELDGESLKVDWLEDEAAITDKGKKSKVFIQSNYFYHTEGASGTSNWNSADGHYDKANDYTNPKGGKLDRFEIPLEAVVTLISRKDAPAWPQKSDGVESPEATGDVKIKWTVIDPEEDFSLLPPFIAETAPSRSKQFIKEVNTRVKALPGGNNNCPQQCGGVRSTDHYFERLFAAIPVAQGATNMVAETKVLSNAHHKWNGKTGVLFRGSNIAGDNFKIKASISFEGLANENPLTTANTALRDPSVLSAETGEFTVWKLSRVACVINWTHDTLPDVDWSEITPQFEAAFCKLDISNCTTKRILDLAPTSAKAQPYFTLCVEEMIPAHKTPDPVQRNAKMNRVKGRMQLSNDHMFPYPLLKGDDLEKTFNESDINFLDRVSQWADDFRNGLTRLTLGNDQNGSVGHWLAGLNNEANRPGLIVLRALPFKGYDVTGQRGLIVKKTVVTEPAKYRNEGSSCTGIGGGTAYICESYRKILKDGFLTAHEVAHLFYLHHPFQQAGEHDSSDENCTMWYLHTKAGQAPVNRKDVKLHVGSNNKPHFCGKCLLKLRGWKVRDPNITVYPAGSPGQRPTPLNPVMQFTGYKIQNGAYQSTQLGKPTFIPLSHGAKDPQDGTITLGPMKFLHEHKLTWESSDGDLRSLAGIKTREKVVYNNPTQGAPFCEAADPDQDFTQLGVDADKGECFDDHSVMWPALICDFPRTAGKITANQVYEYQLPPYTAGTWTPIPEAYFILEKEVLEKTPGNWVLKFTKKNDPAHNPTAFLFEIEYKIGQRPASAPDYVLNPTAQHLPGKNYALEGSAAIFRAGPRKALYTSRGSKTDVTLDQLTNWGFIA